MKEVTNLLTKEEATKWLDTLEEPGHSMVLCMEGDLRIPALYMGEENGVYYFIDTNGSFGISKQFINRGSASIDRVVQDGEFEVMSKIIYMVKGGE